MKEGEASVKRYSLLCDYWVSLTLCWLCSALRKVWGTSRKNDAYGMDRKAWLHVKIICAMPVSTLLNPAKPIGVCGLSRCVLHTSVRAAFLCLRAHVHTHTHKFLCSYPYFTAKCFVSCKNNKDKLMIKGYIWETFKNKWCFALIIKTKSLGYVII